MIPTEILEIINSFVNEVSPNEVWGIGSRFNGDHNENSDWDFLVFLDKVPLENKRRNGLVDFILTDGKDNGIIKLESESNNTGFTFQSFKFMRTGKKTAEYQALNKSNTELFKTYDSNAPKCILRNAFLIISR